MWYTAHENTAIKPPSSLFIVLSSLFFAFVLEFLPWNVTLLELKPVFPLLMLIYWVLHYPRLINFTAGVIIGVIIDLANQAPLGFNAVSCTFIVFLTNSFYGRFVLLGGFGQMVQVIFILSVGQISLYCLSFLETEQSLSALSWSMFKPSISAGVMWLFIPIVLRYFRRRGEN